VVSAEQAIRFDPLLYVEVMIQLRTIITLRNGAKGLCPQRSPFSYGPSRSQSKPMKVF